MPMTRTAMTPAPLWQVGRGLPEAGAAGAVGAVLPEVPGDRAADGESGGAGADAAALPARGEAAPAEEPGKRGASPAHGASSFPWGLPLSNLAAKTPPFWVVFFHYFLGVCPQELQTRLSDEIGKLRSFISSRCSGDRSQNNERSSCELEVRGWQGQTLKEIWARRGTTGRPGAVQEGGAQASPLCLSWGTSHHFPLPSSPSDALAPARGSGHPAALCFPLP